MRLKTFQRPPKPLKAFRFKDDGITPNHPFLSCVLLREAIDLRGSSRHDEVIMATFERNGWGGLWRSVLYPYPHYHAQIHEAVAIASGRTRVRIGGAHGAEIELKVGDVLVVPAGTCHQRLRATSDLVVIGAYPPNGQYDMCRLNMDDHAKAKAVIPHVPLPPTDPVHGTVGRLLKLWAAEARGAAGPKARDAA